VDFKHAVGTLYGSDEARRNGRLRRRPWSPRRIISKDNCETIRGFGIWTVVPEGEVHSMQPFLMFILSDLVQVTEACEHSGIDAEDMLTESIVGPGTDIGSSVRELLNQISLHVGLHRATLRPVIQQMHGWVILNRSGIGACSTS
jgi:hypothetical protein